MAHTPAQHLIVAGVTRAGTTSLYNYLADHPCTRRSTIKETRFFLDHDELKRLHRFEEGTEAYNNFFPDCPAGAVKLEATPDYFYRPAVAQRIAESLPDAHVVVILREPVARLVSWRRYAIQNGLLDPGTTLAEYIRIQFDAEATGEPLPQHMRALREGRYSCFLAPWVQAFRKDRLDIIHYRDLMDDPARVTQRLCERVGIDPGFYNDYAFDIHNASRRVRWPGLHSAYRSLIWRVKPYVHDKPATRTLFRRLRRATDSLLGRSGEPTRADDPGDVLTDTDRRRLEDYYRDEPAALSRLLGDREWAW